MRRRGFLLLLSFVFAVCFSSSAFAEGTIAYGATWIDNATGNTIGAIQTVPDTRGGQPTTIISSLLSPSGILLSELQVAGRPSQQWSPDGSRLSFRAWVKSGEGSLYVIPATQGATPINLTPGIKYIFHSASWSPDGQNIAFSGETYTNYEDYLYIVPSNGGPLNQLTSVDTRWPVYSPDGTKIAFTYQGGLSVMPSGGGTPTQVDTSIAFGRVSWSPDSKQITYGKANSANYSMMDVYIADLAANTRTNLTNGTFSLNFPTPTFSPDGTMIAFMVSNGSRGGTSIYKMPAAGGTPEILATDVSGTVPYEGLGWSPDSKKIAYPYDSGLGDWKMGIATVDVSSGQEQKLTPANYSFIDNPIYRPEKACRPIEAAIRFDVASKDIKVYDSETGTEASYSVLPPQKDEREDKEAADEQDGDSSKELRQYTLRDCANNTLILTLEHKKEGDEIKVNIVGMQYNSGPVNAANGKIEAEYAQAGDNTIKEFEQKAEVKDQFEIEAKYGVEKNGTTIRIELPGQNETQETKAGMAILELMTDKGSLKYKY